MKLVKLKIKDYMENEKPKFKVQSAMEYLTTYGWAILLIAIILIAFFDLGVFGNGNATSTTCLAEVGFSCSNPLLNSTGNFSVELGNSFNYPLNITGVGCSNSTSAPSTFIPFLTQIFSNGQSNLTYQCTMQSNNIGASFAGTLWIQYNNNQVAQVATISGKATTAGSIGNNGQGVFYLTNEYGGTSGYGNIIEINGQTGNVINAIDFQIQNNYFDGPSGIAIFDSNAYITNQNNNNVIIFNNQNNNLIGSITSSIEYPSGIAFLGSNAYITNFNGGPPTNGGNVIIFNTLNSQINAVPPSTSFDHLSGIAFYDANAYITNRYGGSGSGNVIVFDTKTQQISQLPSTSFYYPSGIAFLGSNAYITNGGSNNVIIFDTTTSQTTQLPSTSFDNPTGIAFYDSNAYITNSGSNNVIIYNTQTQTISSVPPSSSFDDPLRIAISGQYAYITNEYGGPSTSGNVLVLNTLNNNIISAISPSSNYIQNPSAITINGDLAYVIGTIYNQQTLFTINLFTKQITNSVSSSSINNPSGIAFSGSNAYITNQGSNNVIIFDTTTSQTTQLPSTSFYSPSGIAFSGSNAYITNSGSSNVLIYNTQTNNIVGSITSSIEYPSGIAFLGSNAYITNVVGGSGSGNVIIFNTQTNDIVGAITSPSIDHPTHITASGKYLYVYNGGSGNVIVINTQTQTISSVPSSSSFDDPYGLAAP